MREILFRGKRVDNGEWVYGYYAHFKDMHDVKADIIYTGYADIHMGSLLPECYDVNPETVGQYTGLSDKNGVKIFENDIVRYGKKNWVVNWNDETFRWEISLKDGCYQYPIYDGQGYPKYVDRITLGWVAAEFQLSGQLSVEVIGNKFDNPELIERDNNEKDWIF